MNVTTRSTVLAAFALASLTISAGANAQADAQKKMGFFLTSTGSGKGADLGGLAEGVRGDSGAGGACDAGVATLRLRLRLLHRCLRFRALRRLSQPLRERPVRRF